MIIMMMIINWLRIEMTQIPSCWLSSDRQDQNGVANTMIFFSFASVPFIKRVAKWDPF